MDKQNKTDVIVVGAGPAGIMGLEAISRGFGRVVAFEKILKSQIS